MTVLDERFPRWFETIELEYSRGRRFSALRAAAQSIGANLDRRALFALVEYAFGSTSDRAFAAVRAAVSRFDLSFEVAATDLEPRLVAAAALAVVLEGTDDAAALVAGAVRSAEFAGLGAPIDELPELARAAQERRFRHVRETEPEGSRAPAEGNGALATAALLAQLERRLQTRLDAADEELDMLWWAFAATATAAVEPLQWQGIGEGRHGHDLEPAQALLRRGRELADRHRFHAEIPSARELLRRVLGSSADQEYSLAELVAAAPPEQIGVDGLQPSPLLPLLTCLAIHRDAPPADAFAFDAEPGWVEQARALGVDPSRRHKGDELANQFLREILIARMLGDG
jgi:hypothetical protein